jgi:hypothetical protein
MSNAKSFHRDNIHHGIDGLIMRRSRWRKADVIWGSLFGVVKQVGFEGSLFGAVKRVGFEGACLPPSCIPVRKSRDMWRISSTPANDQDWMP